jgi:hypothetical protein
MIVTELHPGQGVQVGPYALRVSAVHSSKVVFALFDPSQDCAGCGQRPARRRHCSVAKRRQWSVPPVFGPGPVPNVPLLGVIDRRRWCFARCPKNDRMAAVHPGLLRQEASGTRGAADCIGDREEKLMFARLASRVVHFLNAEDGPTAVVLAPTIASGRMAPCPSASLPGCLGRQGRRTGAFQAHRNVWEPIEGSTRRRCLRGWEPKEHPRATENEGLGITVT